MKILICGLGSIGKRHARILQKMGGHEIFALRTYQGQEKNDLGIKELKSWEEVDRYAFDIALITNPTCLHVTTALECARRRMHLFIEKPIGASLENLDPLLNLVEEKSLTAYVAYPLRFHPVIETLKKRIEGQKILHARATCASFLPEWRSNQNHYC